MDKVAGNESLEILLPPQAVALLERLKVGGLHGETIQEVAASLVLERLRVWHVKLAAKD
jgi:hypothetical protein